MFSIENSESSLSFLANRPKLRTLLLKTRCESSGQTQTRGSVMRPSNRIERDDVARPEWMLISVNKAGGDSERQNKSSRTWKFPH